MKEYTELSILRESVPLEFATKMFASLGNCVLQCWAAYSAEYADNPAPYPPSIALITRGRNAKIFRHLLTNHQGPGQRLSLPSPALPTFGDLRAEKSLERAGAWHFRITADMCCLSVIDVEIPGYYPDPNITITRGDGTEGDIIKSAVDAATHERNVSPTADVMWEIEQGIRPRSDPFKYTLNLM